MKLEIVEVSGGLAGNPIPVGCVAVGKNGNGVFHKSDLDKLGISDVAVLLADAGELVVALRAPKPSEKGIGAKVSGKGNRRHIGLLPALRRLGFKGQDVAGRYKLETVEAGKVLAIRLAGKQLSGDKPKHK